MKNYRLFLLLIILLVIAFMADIAIGSVNLSIRDVWDTLTGGSDNLIYREIIINHRLPKALTAILAGASAIEICSAIYQNTNLFVGEMNRFLSAWMERKGFKHISQFKGKLNAKDVEGINMFERTQFLKYFSEK